MTITNLPRDRPIPDADDLRLLAELINNVAIPLANAAWNARMSQAEAAARLVSMAERGLPLRLVADGDRNALWQIAQAGPVQAAPAAMFEPTTVPRPTVPAAEPPSAPPAATSPAHGATDGGAVVSSDSAVVSMAPADAAAVAESTEPQLSEPQSSERNAWEQRVPEPAAPHDSAPRWARYPVTGPAGEQLLVTVLDVRDPSDAVLTAAGRPLAVGYRAVLVRSHVANVGSVYYPASADANLVLETDRHELLGRSGPMPASHPGFAIGVAPGQVADGWSLFVIPVGTVLAGLKWCIRPDIPQTIVSWPIAP